MLLPAVKCCCCNISLPYCTSLDLLYLDWRHTLSSLGLLGIRGMKIQVGITSVGLSISPDWETPFSPSFPTRIANLGLKAKGPPLIPVLGTQTESGRLVPVAITNQD